MIEIRPLSTFTFGEALEIWNKSFEGYVYDQTMGLDQFIFRFGNEDLLPSLSIVAMVDGEPAGLVLNGLRTINGKKVAWNGGTGVYTKFRRHGVGKAMIQASIEIYKEQNVDLAILEAAKSNEPAIRLYKQYGYELIEELTFLKHEGALANGAFSQFKVGRYGSRRGIAIDVQHLDIGTSDVPWQTQWQGLRKDGELLVVTENGDDIAYFLFKRVYTPDGKLNTIILFHTVIIEGREDASDIAQYALNQIWGPSSLEVTRMTFNYPKKNRAVVEAMENEGFKPFTEQVLMVKPMK
ncbi:GNAT family N-acetyltransferase [Fervidibacillus halotolerans]|uniref:GNAT family N-acetyltransferase n=1 Tax=Fervidibacillus halotolerans TaxID=2980027 RepID=A0A9E8M1T1_9BACI|nr:GNAT family N-acetyltransferase [Fervidibacillus halotolerans]WAA12866.1 GNAT family N-acetyltransferase [Fervidibacillus halotolerans]